MSVGVRGANVLASFLFELWCHRFGGYMGIEHFLLLMVGNAEIQIMYFYVARHGHVNIAGLVMPIKGEAQKYLTCPLLFNYFILEGENMV